MISNRLQKHMVAAAVVATGIAASANATIQYSGIKNLVIPATFAGLYINMETGASGGNSTAGWDLNPYGNGYMRTFAATGAAWARAGALATENFAGSFATGTVISAASLFTTGITQVQVGAGNNQWDLNAINFFGFRFVNAAAQTCYGYGRMELGSTINTRTLIDWYWDDAGAQGSVTIPAPGAVALMGLAGLVGKRRRR